MTDLRTRLTIDDYFSAWQYLASKNEQHQKSLQQAEAQRQVAQMSRHRGIN